MYQLLESLQQFAERTKAANKTATRVALFLILGIILSVGGYFVGNLDYLRAFAGGIGGVLFFIAAYLYWYGLSSDRVYIFLNWRERIPYSNRWRRTILFLGIWFAVEVIINHFFTITGSGPGAINVLFLIAALLAATRTREEVIEQEAIEAAKAEENIFEAEEQATKVEPSKEKRSRTSRLLGAFGIPGFTKKD